MVLCGTLIGLRVVLLSNHTGFWMTGYDCTLARRIGAGTGRKGKPWSLPDEI